MAGCKSHPTTPLPSAWLPRSHPWDPAQLQGLIPETAPVCPCASGGDCHLLGNLGDRLAEIQEVEAGVNKVQLSNKVQILIGAGINE